MKNSFKSIVPAGNGIVSRYRYEYSGTPHSLSGFYGNLRESFLTLAAPGRTPWFIPLWSFNRHTLIRILHETCRLLLLFMQQDRELDDPVPMVGGGAGGYKPVLPAPCDLLFSPHILHVGSHRFTSQIMPGIVRGPKDLIAS